MNCTLRILRGLAVLIPLTCPIARATLLCLPNLAPGGLESPNVDDTCPADHNGTNPIGTLVSDTGVQAFSLTGSGITTTGNIREVVYQETVGTLDFYIQAQVLSGGALSEVSNANTGDFTNFLTLVGTVSPIQLLGSPNGSVNPTFDTRSSAGDTIEWNYLSGITNGKTSFTMAISTNATKDTGSSIGLLGADGGTETVNGFEPLPGSQLNPSVPEPVSIVLLGTVLAGLGFVARRRSRRNAQCASLDKQG